MKQIKKPGNNIYATTPSTNSVDHVMANNSIRKQTIKQSKKYKLQDQFNQPIQHISKANENFGIDPVNLESIHHFLIASNLNKEKKYLSPQPEPVANKVKLNTRNNNERGFYAGIMFGVDMSSVHFQSQRPVEQRDLLLGMP